MYVICKLVSFRLRTWPIRCRPFPPRPTIRASTVLGFAASRRCALKKGAEKVIALAAPVSTMNCPFVRAHRLLAANPRTVEALSVGLEGKGRQRIGHVRNLQIGEFQISNPVAGFSQATKGPMAGNGVGAGLIGGEILRRFNITFDYAHKRCMLEA